MSEIWEAFIKFMQKAMKNGCLKTPLFGAMSL